MNDDAFLILFLMMVVVGLLWFFVWGPQAQKTRAERKRWDNEERERREAERGKLLEEREDLLKAVRSAAPGYILKARLEFERDYSSKGGEDVDWH